MKVNTICQQCGGDMPFEYDEFVGEVHLGIAEDLVSFEWLAGGCDCERTSEAEHDALHAARELTERSLWR